MYGAHMSFSPPSSSSPLCFLLWCRSSVVAAVDGSLVAACSPQPDRGLLRCHALLLFLPDAACCAAVACCPSSRTRPAAPPCPTPPLDHGSPATRPAAPPSRVGGRMNWREKGPREEEIRRKEKHRREEGRSGGGAGCRRAWPAVSSLAPPGVAACERVEVWSHE